MALTAAGRPQLRSGHSAQHCPEQQAERALLGVRGSRQLTLLREEKNGHAFRDVVLVLE